MSFEDEMQSAVDIWNNVPDIDKDNIANKKYWLHEKKVREAIEEDIKAISEIIIESEDIFSAIKMLEDFRTSLRKRLKELGLN